MKKNIFTFIIGILFLGVSYAQFTYIPDDNFEQALIDLGYDLTLNNNVLTSNISTITSLDIRNKNIEDLTGIEDFVALQQLYIDNNNLTGLNLTQNTALTELSCTNNSLVDLDLSANTALFHLDARFNQLTNIDVSQNTLLSILTLEDNQLTFLNLNPNSNLNILNVKNNNLGALSIKNGNNTALTVFDATRNSGLICIQVEDLAHAATNWTSIDPQTSFNLDCSALLNTYVPDNNFEQALIDLGYDTVLDDYVLTSNINTVTELNVQNKNIEDLTGIKDFVALELLRCDVNNLTTLDVSQNTALIELSCAANNLTSLDVTQNTQLETLLASGNQLTGLYVRQNTQLNNLQVHSNNITSIDVSKNTLLTFLNVNDNQLISLNVKNGTNTAITTFTATDNPFLICIEVDDVVYSVTNWNLIDIHTSFSEDCKAQTYVPDDNFEQALIDLGYDAVLDDNVFTSNINTVTELNLFNLNISDLTGIQDFAALEVLNCTLNNLTSLDVSKNSGLTTLQCTENNLTTLDVSQNLALTLLHCNNNQLSSLDISQNLSLTELQCIVNSITSLDVSKNTALTVLDCRFNQLTSIDVTQNTALTFLNINSNQLTSLDVSQNSALTSLFCNTNSLTNLDLSKNVNLELLECKANQLTSLNVKNGNNTLLSIFNTTSNPNLICVDVDNVAYSTTNWTNIDAQTSFSEDCSAPKTYVPDDNFEQALIDLGYDSGPLNNYVPTANINTITSLDVSGKAIVDLTGIEDFTALEILNCMSNELTSLDISQNTALTTLNLMVNELNSLDISQNTLLESLRAGGNQLTSLNVSANTALTLLDLVSNNLTSLDVSQNTALEVLNCASNQVQNLDVSNNIMLVQLVCANNQITSLNLSQQVALTYLSCESNQLTSLNVKNGNNINVTFFNSINNPNLTCIEVDTVAYSTTNWTNIDARTSFSEDCSSLNTKEVSFNKDAVKLFPNPVFDVLKIKASKIIDKISFFNIQGKKVFETLNTSSISINHLSNGVYIVKIYMNKNMFIKKIIKR